MSKKDYKNTKGVIRRRKSQGRQYNGNKGQEYKQWSTKHCTEN